MSAFDDFSTAASRLAPAQRARLDPGLLHAEAQPGARGPRMSVIIEASLPASAQVSIQRRSVDGFRPTVADAGTPCPTDPQNALEIVHQHLCAMELDTPPVVLSQACAVVANLLPEQVLALAQLPEVALIRPNRAHRV